MNNNTSTMKNDDNLAELTAKFMKIYSNLPADERSEIIIIIDNETYTWSKARDEIDSNTKTGKKILSRLKELRIL